MDAIDKFMGPDQDLVEAPNEDYDDKLAYAVWDSRQRLRPFREATRRYVEDFQGPRYGELIDRDRLPVNRGALAVITVLHKLMSNDPRVLCTTRRDDLETSALEREAALNEWIVREKAAHQLNRAVLAAMFCHIGGVVKVGVTPYRFDDRFDPGKTSLWHIGQDDWVQDMTARGQEDWGFCGHKYRIPLHRVIRDPSISYERRKEISETIWRPYTEFGDLKVQALSESTRYPREYQQYVDCWEIWLPEEGVLKTYIGDGGSQIFNPRPIKVVRWEGPVNGPYHVLRFHDVLDNSMQQPPVELYYDLHVSCNVIANKIIRQGEGMKKLLLVSKSMNQADVGAINDAVDGQTVGVDNPKEAQQQVTIGGPDQAEMLLLTQLLNQFSIQGGNIDQLAGVEAQAPTASQEQMLAQSASGTITAMQGRIVSWLVPIFTDVSDWLFGKHLGDPMLNIATQRPIGASGMMMPFSMTPDLIEGDNEDFYIEVAPYSYIYRTPQQRLQGLMAAINAIMPLMQAAAQGAPINIEYVVSLFARYTNQPELERILTPGGGGQPQPQGMPGEEGEGGPGMALGGRPQTREYIRKDRHQNGAAQQNSEFMSALGSLGKSNGQAA